LLHPRDQLLFDYLIASKLLQKNTVSPSPHILSLRIRQRRHPYLPMRIKIDVTGSEGFMFNYIDDMDCVKVNRMPSGISLSYPLITV
jgi:hypothetical protein